MKFSKKEIIDLGKAWFAIAIAFTIVLKSSYEYSFFLLFLLSAFTVGLGFLFHELAHKYIAQRYGCFAEFKAFNLMLVLAIALSLFGFIFAAPGAVFISGHVNKKKNGKIAAAGPLTNIILALLFFFLAFISAGFLENVGKFGFKINTWLALFNMIPFGPFDGAKIWRWHKIYYLLMVVLLAVFFIFS